jgi:hypothetical protein
VSHCQLHIASCSEARNCCARRDNKCVWEAKE